MRRVLASFGIVLALAVALTGCAKKTDTASTQSSTDSLLSTNPVEQPQGNLTPSQQYQNTPPAEQTPPAPAASNNAPTRHHTTTRHHEGGGGGGSNMGGGTAAHESGVTVAAGTALDVTLHSAISSENAQVGDTWTGEVKDNVIVGQTVVIPAGSVVNGVVNAVTPAGGKNSRASLALAVKSVTVNGQSHALSASTEPVVAGSARARNIGAVAGAAAVGAVIGHAVGGGKGTLIGGLLGGGAAAAAAAKSKCFQVVIKDGTNMTFNVDTPVTMRQ